MPTKKSVYEIFQTMDTSDTDKTQENVEHKEWLKNFRKTDIHPETTDENVGFDSSSWKLMMKKIVSSIEVNWEFLAYVLNETLFNIEDSKEIVTVFRKDLNFYFGMSDGFFYIQGQESVDLHVSEKDLFILGRLIAPLLIAGYVIYIYPIHTSVLPYLAAIGHLITKAGVPKGIKYILKSDSQASNDPTRFVIGADITTHYCPMIIFDDADLYSALDCLVDSALRFNGMLYWSITHVYIQESVFDNFVTKVQDLSRRMPQIMLLGCNQLDKLKDNMESKILKLFIGWDPRDLELNLNLRMAASVLPFRTNDEVISLVNSQNIACTASIWTEKISVANHVSRSLKIGTIWINSHGNIDPKVPFESFSESHLPLNGAQILEYISSLIKLNTTESTIQITENKNVHYSKSVEEAVNHCQRGYELLTSFDDKTIKELLDLIVNAGLSQSNIPLSSSSNEDAVYHVSSKMDVLCFSSSYKVVMVLFPTEDVPLNICLKIIYHLIETRNAIIICGVASRLKDFSLGLPPEIITLLDIKNYNKCNEHNKRIGKIFNIYFKNFGKISKDLGNSICLNSIFKGKKSIWMPTY
ncbi:hypothetical protein O3M35_008595 [Rhynocoris fuscipes]|uniref:Aldehyde dehydrogenase domain-containing protein n=1 Tax=Rhynocoris fuscipes TaxID=488301 RepID=A0AAW1DAA9_9HEMI